MSASPYQILQFGHTATALRKVIESKGWTMAELVRQIGFTKSHSGVYAWVNGTSQIPEIHREKLSKITGIPISELTPRDPENVPAVYSFPKATPTTRTGDVLAFTVASDGNARIKLDVSLPVDRAMPLLRMLLDAGLVFTNEGNANG